MDAFSSEVCVICHKVFTNPVDKVSVTTKGIKTIGEFAEFHNDVELGEYLLSIPSDIFVHAVCRKQYTDKRKCSQTSSNTSGSPVAKRKKSLRSSSEQFNWMEHCFLCANPLHADAKHADRNRTRTVQTMKIRETMLTVCARRNDKWSADVHGRIEMFSDLVAADASYHKVCHDAFVQGRSLPDKSDTFPSTNGLAKAGSV